MLFSKFLERKKDSTNNKDKKKQTETYNEFDVCNYFIKELVKLGKEDSLFRIEQRCDRYLSLVYGNNDFLRVHISKIDNTKWITIAMFNENKKKYINSELFSAQTNKNQIHWKANIGDFSDYQKFINIAFESCFVLKVAGDEPLTEDEEKIAQFLKNLYIECGAEESEIYFRHLSDHAEIYYFEWPTTIKFKTYKKKNNCIWIYYDIAKKLNITCEKDGKIEFIKLNDLNKIKPYIENRVIEMKKDKCYYKNCSKEETGYTNLRKI